jgi:hypothetical protein
LINFAELGDDERDLGILLSQLRKNNQYEVGANGWPAQSQSNRAEAALAGKMYPPDRFLQAVENDLNVSTKSPAGRRQLDAAAIPTE